MNQTNRFVSISPQAGGRMETPCLLCVVVELDGHRYTFALHPAAPVGESDLAISLYETGQRLGYLRNNEGRNIPFSLAQHYGDAALSTLITETITRLYSRIGPGLKRVLDQSLRTESWLNGSSPETPVPDTPSLPAGATA